MTPDDIAEIVAALERLGVEGPAAALDVLDAAPLPLTESDRTAVVERLAYVRQRRVDAHTRAVQLTQEGR